jgi:hypothetical protein
MTTSRTRNARRSSRTAIWRGAVAVPAEEASVQHGVRERPLAGGSRMISAIIVLGMVIVLLTFFLTDAFYVRGAVVGGNEFLSVADVYTIAGMDGWHLFWIDPVQVRQNLINYPTIAEAEVQIGWPPNILQITVQERAPALIWEQAGVQVWLDLQGRVMSERRDIDGLLRVVVDSIDADVLSLNTRLPVDVVSGALQLRQLQPDLTTLRYDPSRGLGYNDPRGWAAWFGSGADMAEKMLIYEAVVADILANGIAPSEIDVGNPDAPVYCCRAP